MKRFAASSILSIALALLPCISSAQSITVNSVSGTGFCAGDSISVTFQVSGYWGHLNAFTMQLSDPTGSFSNTFQNLGSLNDTLPGTFTVTAVIPSSIVASTHYRVRITGAKPSYVASADNGTDLTVGSKPTFDLEIADFTTYVTTRLGGLFIPVGAQVDSSVQVLLPNLDTATSANTTYTWDFGSGATPTSASGLGLTSKVVTYSTAGDKTVTLTATGSTGCDTSGSIKYHVFDCTNPSIPHYAEIDSAQDQVVFEPDKVIWVNPGVTLDISGGKDTLFCESGSTIISNEAYSVVYLKPGATYTEHGAYNTIIHADGVSLDFGKPGYEANIHCPALDFDYSNAPPNIAFPQSGVKRDLTTAPITLSPNPTSGILQVHGLPVAYTSISVCDVLGETLIMQQHSTTSDLTLDLTKLAPGTYYVRISSPNSVVTKKVIRN